MFGVLFLLLFPVVAVSSAGPAAGGCGAPRDVLSKSGTEKAERRRGEPSASQAGGPQVLLTISPRRLRRRGCAKWGFLTHWPQAYYKPPAVLCSQLSSQWRSANIHDPVLTLPCAVQSTSVRCYTPVCPFVLISDHHRNNHVAAAAATASGEAKHLDATDQQQCRPTAVQGAATESNADPHRSPR